MTGIVWTLAGYFIPVVVLLVAFAGTSWKDSLLIVACVGWANITGFIEHRERSKS